ncbi:SEA (Seh1-associated) complex subunit [Zygosaccharomyces mellis]|uniref:Restriction of telomere capping protein 1 n=1 Tax=Zygosaccharomyces mellis TaxID=42258 RepID=A0A4C2E6N6_9SACH|nr:SEA (Seh1-associated) complex subunit [Zygosaccharomyces mellis]
MSNRPIPRNQASSSLSRSELKPGLFGRSSFRVQHYSGSNGISPISSSPRPKISPRYSFASSFATSEPSFRESTLFDERLPVQDTSVPKSSGLYYSTASSKELSSIDKINDLSFNGIVCAGKTHLGLYKFSPQEKSIDCVHDFMSTGNDVNRGNTNVHMGLGKRSKRTKLSTIADVKAGFHNHKNYVAICSNSTVLSIYDINKTGTIDNPLVTNCSQHVRSVNSFDFNTVQTNLIISGGQDSCIKVWDLRSSRGRNLSRADININTASDSIRDVKWMPQPAASRSVNQNDLRSGNNSAAGYKFASIHDSGLLLKFDLRQPNQVEKRINAHSGPGLCLNWHPYQDYISTGGRDGKCCLWYVGDGKPTADFLQSGNMSTITPHSMTSNLPTNLSAVPDMTINCGFPVTKLKVRPSYERNVLNSLVAMSSMAEDFGVSIYSLARKYIPKYNLSTSSASLGFVWWDDNLIFNIDKDSRINGWYLDREPTVLDNMPKIVTRWRDIEGNGFLFIDQDRGGYQVNDETPSNIEEFKKTPNQRVSMSSLNGATGGGNIGGNNSGMIGSIKKGISQTGLTSFTGERPVLSKTGLNLSNKSLTTQSINHSHSNSFSSSTGAGPFNEAVDRGGIDSPFLMTLDLPYILNNMRVAQLPPDRKSLYSPEVQAIRESPVKVFKFLAKELEFSYMQERRAGDVKGATQLSNSNEDTTKRDLMEKFGISEKTTWAALVNKKNEAVEAISKKSSSTKEDSESVIESDSEISNGNNSDEAKKDGAKGGVMQLQEKIDILLELIPICGHNASVYSYIDDLPNFKIWILIRDSLLWDLETFSREYPNEKLPDTQSTDQVGQPIIMGNDDSIESDTRSYITSDLNYFVEEHPKALRSDSEEPRDCKRPPSGLKSQLTKIQETESSTEDSFHSPEMMKKIDNNTSQEQLNSQLTNDSDNAVVDEGDNEDKFDFEAHIKGIPIVNKRRPRRSFIDTYMGGLRSPIDSNINNEFFMGKLGHSLGHSSPKSKISPMASLNDGEFAYPGFKKMASGIDRRSSGSLFLSPLKRRGSSTAEFFDKSPMRPLSPLSPKPLSNVASVESLPPWNTRRLLKQIFKQAVEMGNILLVVNILFLFQNLYQLTSTEVLKNTLAEFIKILHKHELFELSAAISKCSPWEVAINADGGQSLVPIFCDRCGKLITNETSKEKFTLEAQEKGDSVPLERFGYWYCDSCKKPNTLCVFCERPIKTLAIGLLECGHEGHFQCLQSWFLDEGMVECPGGCMNQIHL